MNKISEESGEKGFDSAFIKRNIYEKERMNKNLKELSKNKNLPTVTVRKFVLEIYNSDNEELKKEMLKFFDIKKLKKENLEENSEKFFEEKSLDELMITYDSSKKQIDLITEEDDLVMNNKNNNNNTIIEVKNENDEQEGKKEETKVELKNSIFYRYLNLLILFFKKEYPPLNLMLKMFNEISKTGMLSLMIFKLFGSLTILSMLNGTGNDDEEKSSRVK